jgi:exopolysaccharide production protein ExoQ
MKKYKLNIWLIVILALMVAGYFTVSENIAITRVVKVFLRISMSGAIYLIYRKISVQFVPSFSKQNTLAPFFYYLYLFLGLCSLMWSTKPSYSFLQLLMTAQSLVFVYFFNKTIVLFNQYNQADKLNFHQIFGKSVFLILLVFIIGKWINPDAFFRLTHGGEVARLGGYFMNPNELGMLAVIGLAMFVMEMKENGLGFVNVFMFLVVLWALILTGSRSSMIGFMLILLFFVVKSKNQKIKAAVLIGMIVSIPFIVNMIFIKQGDLEEVMSMTGRLPFWKALLTESLPREPYFGFGFMRIAYADAFQSVHTYAGKMTHNTFIQVLMNLGFVGLFIVILQMTFTFSAFIRSGDKYNKSLFVGISIPIIINSFTEFGIYGETNFGILYWQFLIFLFYFKFESRMTLIQKVKLKKQMKNKLSLVS